MFNFIPPTIPHNIFVIGAGGTGGRLIPMLSQFLRSITRGMSATGWIEAPNIWLIDDDVVEAKNILRQNFIDMDVGKHKAAVLADRYTRAYGVNIVPILMKAGVDNAPDIYNTVTETIKITTGATSSLNIHAILDTSIVIMCVDTAEARRGILQMFITKTGRAASGRTFFIDAGNEDSFGQVSFFNPVILCSSEDYTNLNEGYKVPKLVPVKVDTNYIPMDPNYYRNLIDTPAQGSCADLNQTLSINAMMATTIMGIVQNYFYRKPMTYNTVSLSLDGGNFTTYNTFSNFRSRALSKADTHLWSNGIAKVTEKYGTAVILRFGLACEYIGLYACADLLTTEIARVKEEKDKAERIEYLELLKKQRVEAKAAETLKKHRESLEEVRQQSVLEEMRRIESLALEVEARRVVRQEEALAALVTNDVVEVEVEVEVEGNYSATDPVRVADVTYNAVDVPVLQPVARQRRTVDLSVPDSWIATPEIPLTPMVRTAVPLTVNVTSPDVVIAPVVDSFADWEEEEEEE
jgi:molybdopterin/thiamine biosynthesis adenylyltransferase